MTDLTVQPGPVELRHVKVAPRFSDESQNPSVGTRVLATQWEAQDRSGVNGDGGFSAGSYERRLTEAGSGEVSFPNTPGSDGALNRQRFAALADEDYGVGDEWIEAYWRDETTPFAVLTPSNGIQVTRTLVKLGCTDGLGSINRVRETAAGIWRHAPRDVVEHYLGAWVPVACEGMEEIDPTAALQNGTDLWDAVGTATGWVASEGGHYDVTGDGVTEAYVQGDAAGANAYRWGRNAAGFYDRNRCARFETLLRIPSGLNVTVGFRDSGSPTFKVAAVVNPVAIGGTPGAVRTVSGTEFGAVAQFVNAAKTFANHGTTWHVAVELRGPWAFYYVDGNLIDVLPALFDDPNPAGHDGDGVMIPFVAVGGAGTVEIDSLLVREHRPYLLRHPTDASARAVDGGDLHLPGIPPPGGLWGEYFDDADLRQESGDLTQTTILDDFQSYTYGPTALSAQTGPNGAWTESGDTDDWVTTNNWSLPGGMPPIPPPSARRWPPAADANENTGQYARAGSGVKAAIAVEAELSSPLAASATAGQYWLVGLFARYVDVNNWVMVVLRGGPVGGVAKTQLMVRKRVAGTVTDLGAVDVTMSQHYVGRHKVSLEVDSAGAWSARSESLATGNVWTLNGTDATLATGGALDDGGYGLYNALAYASAPQSGLGWGAWNYKVTTPTASTVAYRGRVLSPEREPRVRRQDATLNFASALPPTWQAVATPGGQRWSARWTGAVYLDLEAADKFLRLVVGAGPTDPDRVRLWVGRTMWGDQLVDTWWDAPPATTLTTPSLRTHLTVNGAYESGWYPIVIEYAHVVERGALQLQRANVAGGPFVAVPSDDLSPLGVFDAETRFEPHDELVASIAQAFGYQFVQEPQSLESGEFPCRIRPRVRVGRDTEYVLESGEASDLARAVNAEDVAHSLIGDAQGLGRDDESQITAERVDFARTRGAFFVRTDHESLSDVSSPQLLDQRLDSLLALRGGPWEEVGAKAPGFKELLDSFPLTGSPTEFAWTPGDGVRLRFPELDVEDVTPRQIVGVTRAFTPNGLGDFTASFRQRTRNLRAMLRKIARLQAVRNRHYQGQLTVLNGTVGVYGSGVDPYSRVTVPHNVQKITKATLVVMTKSSTGACDVSVNDTVWLSGVDNVGDFDITDAVQVELSLSADRAVAASLVSDALGEIVAYAVNLEVVI